MVYARWPVDGPVNVDVLGTPLKFKTALAHAKNRFLKAAMSEQMAAVDNRPEFNGVPTQRLINLFEKFGAGEWGVLLTGGIVVDPRHAEGPGNMLISKEVDSNPRRNQFRRLTDAAKAHKSLIIAQLNHGGRQTLATINPTPFSASDILLDMEIKGTRFGTPIALTTEQVKTEVVDRFVFASLFAYETGFNGVELNAGFGYMLSQFLSPSTNNRTDQYGGSWQNRVRVIDEIYQEIRSRIPAGSGFVIGVKINSAEFQQGGLEQNDVIAIAEHLDTVGFDFIELTGGNFEKTGFENTKESTVKREAYFVEFAGAIKPHIQNAQIYLTGGFKSAPAMVAAINNNDTDGVGLGRPAAAEPDLPKKILSGAVQSASKNLFDADFMISMPAANTQLAQIGSTDVNEARGDLTYGVNDFSNPDEAEPYKMAMFTWFGALCEAGRKGRAELGVFEYHTKSKTSPPEHKGLIQKILDAI